jgi:hypothetical protein
MAKAFLVVGAGAVVGARIAVSAMAAPPSMHVERMTP